MRKLLLILAGFSLVGMMAPWGHTQGLVATDLARVATTVAAYSAGAETTDSGPRQQAFVESGVLDALAGGGRPDVLVRFAGRADLSGASLMRSKQARGEFTFNALTGHADSIQASARQTLQAFGRQPAALEDPNGYQVLWLVNAIAVKAISQTELEALAADPNVSGIELQVVLPPLELEPGEGAGEGARAPASHIAHINAPAVWDLGHTGEGIVIGSTDSGVRHTHAALVGQYRGNLGEDGFDHNYNWFDPYSFSTAPRTEGSHGTHTMGTSVGDDGGDNQIGVAPGAEWIACIGFGGAGGGATTAGLIACGQFALAPTDTNGDNPDPSRAAHVVNNSWGGTVCNSAVDPWYEEVIDAWIAAGIVPVFSMGNASNCQFPNDPPVGLNSSSANLAKSFSIGSSGTNNSQVAPHSIKGPTRNIHPGTPDLPSHFGFQTLKPNVVAPGVDILSSVANSDTAYALNNGTSMSAPAVSGLVALMWDAAECLVGDYATTGNLIMTTARPIPVATGSNVDGIGNVPNVAAGWGEIDALAAVQAAIAHCDDPSDGPLVRATRVINVEAEVGQSVDADLLVENIGINTLTWTVAEAPTSCASTGDVAWLSLSATSGSVDADDAQTVVATASAADLAEGNHSARLCLGSNDSDNALVEIKVNLVVRPVGFVAPFPAPYCAVHAAAAPTVPVSRVLFAGIDNASTPESGAPAHEDFTAQVAQVEAGQVLPFRVELNTLGNNRFSAGVYVDWNNDQILGIEEFTFLGALTASSGTDGQHITADLSIPEDVEPGDYRLRVLSRFAGNTVGSAPSQPINSCGTFNGQGEDYTLRVTTGGGGSTDPVIAVAPASLDFSVAAGGSDSDDLAISNIGGGSLDWSIATAEGASIKPLNLSRGARAAQTVQGGDLRFTGTVAAVPAEQRIRHVAVRGGDPITVRVLTPDTSSPANLIADLNAFPDLDASLHVGTLASLTVADLLPFDVVAINNNNRWSTVAGNDVLVGDVLADYVDAGGKVVVFNYAYDNVGWGLAGRFVSEGYGPFQIATDESSPSVTMDVVDNSHPIFQGVGAVSSTGLIQTLPVHPDADLLASWSNGWAMIAANANTVGFNLLYGPTATWTGDVDVLVHNAIAWLHGSGDGGVCESADEVSWLSVGTTSGSTVGGDTDTTTISVSSAGLAAGSYQARLCVTSNDSAGNELVNVPVTLTVTGGGGTEPIIAVTPTALDFSVDSGDSDSDDLSIGNVGGGTLAWTIQTAQATRATVDLSRPARPGMAARSASSGARSTASIPARPAEHRMRGITVRGGDPVSVLVVSPDGEINTPPDFPAPPQNLVDDLNAFPDTTATLYTGALASVTAAAFQAYDVVIVNNNGRWSSVTGDVSVGDALADYIDAGGKVVVFNYAYDFLGWGLAGRFMTGNYGPFQLATSDSSDAASMVVVNGKHPIFDGVGTVGMPAEFFRLDMALQAGAELLASWSDGLPFIAANDDSIAFNVLYGANPSWTGDLDILVHNAVTWLAGSGGTTPGACGAPGTVPWLNVGTPAGTTAAGVTSTSTITVDASGLAAGTYEAALCIDSNDTATPQVEVPVTLTVTGDPPITDRIFCDGFEQGGDGRCGEGGGPVDPDIVFVDDVNLDFAQNSVGNSINWLTSATCDCDAGDFHFNVWQSGGALAFFNPLRVPVDQFGFVSNGSGLVSVLGSGASIGPSSDWLTGTTETWGTMAAAWRQAEGVHGFMGFRFLNTETGEVNYGYAELSTTGTTGYPATLHRYWYNSAGDPITIP